MGKKGREWGIVGKKGERECMGDSGEEREIVRDSGEERERGGIVVNTAIIIDGVYM